MFEVYRQKEHANSSILTHSYVPCKDWVARNNTMRTSPYNSGSQSNASVSLDKSHDRGYECKPF